jgi:hypothetical protein
MYLRRTYRTIREPDVGNPFELAPSPLTVTLAQQREYAYAASGGDGLDLRNGADDFKVHDAPLG